MTFRFKILLIILLFAIEAQCQYNSHLVVSADTILQINQDERTFIPARQYKRPNNSFYMLFNSISDCEGNLGYTLYEPSRRLFAKDTSVFDTVANNVIGDNDRNWIIPLYKSGKIALIYTNSRSIDIRLIEENKKSIITDTLFLKKGTSNNLSNNSAISRIPQSDSFWLVLRPYNMDYYCYLIDSSGIVDSTFFQTTFLNYAGLEQIAFNHAGNVLAAMTWNGVKNIHLYDFNKKTGQLSNERPLYQNTAFSNIEYFTDLAFSPNDSLLYFTAGEKLDGWNYPLNKVYIFQETVPLNKFYPKSKPTAIYAATYGMIRKNNPKYAWPYSFVEGSDNRIYVTGVDSLLGVIDKPNVKGLNCKYNYKWHKFSHTKLTLYSPQVSTPYYPAFIDVETACGDTATLSYTGDTVYKEMTFYWGDGDSTLLKRGQYWHGMRLKHFYAKRDTVYPVKLAIPVNDCGYKSWRIDSARLVTPPRSAGLQWKQTHECKTNTLELSDSVSFANKVLITWGDGESGLDLIEKPRPYSLKHTYKKGTYDLKIEVSNDYCTHTFDTTFEAGVLPEIQSLLYDSALREPQGTAICAGQQLVLSDTFKNLKSRTIHWGDGMSGGTLRLSKGDSTAKFTHQYSDSGFFTITLYDTSTSDCPFQDSFKVYVRPKPVWKYLLKDTIFCDQFFLTLKTGTQYSDNETYNWNDITNQLGVGTDSTLFWLKTGLLEASVTNICGTQRDTVSIKRLEKPEIKLDSLYDACENISLKLDINNPKNEENYLWSTVETTPTITTTKAGDYWAKAMNYCGEDSVSFKVVLYPKPIPNFAVADVCEGEPVSFTNTTTGGKTFEWRFGDGTISSDSTPNKSYAITQNSRTYFVTLLAKISSNCRDSISKPLNVNATSDAGFTHTSQGKTVFLSQTATEPGESYMWFFGDGDSSTQQNPTHEYPESSGSFYVCLNIINAANCQSKFCDSVRYNVGIVEMETGLFKVYPNPTDGTVHLKFTNHVSHVSISIFNILGERVFEKSDVDGTILKLDIGHLNEGVYFIKVLESDKSAIEKIVMMKQ